MAEKSALSAPLMIAAPEQQIGETDEKGCATGLPHIFGPVL
jgi:hypothetical protein